MFIVSLFLARYAHHISKKASLFISFVIDSHERYTTPEVVIIIQQINMRVIVAMVCIQKLLVDVRCEWGSQWHLQERLGMIGLW